MVDDEPLVSVVLPTYNRMAYLPAAVQSVLDQTFHDWELIVIDDGSTDDTRRYISGISDARIHLIGVEHTGNPARVRNAGIRQARGRYVAFLDSDDVWMPDKLETQIRLLQARDCRWSYTAALPINDAGELIPHVWQRRWYPHDGRILEALLRTDAAVALVTVIVERALLEEVGGFDETFTHVEDYELWHRLAVRSPVCVHPEPTARVRIHTNRFSLDNFAIHEAWVRIYAQAQERVPGQLQSLCRQRRLWHLLVLSRIYSGRLQAAFAFRTLLGAFAYGWPHPAWWLAVARAAVRPFVPAPFIEAARRRRARAMGHTA